MRTFDKKLEVWNKTKKKKKMQFLLSKATLYSGDEDKNKIEYS